MTGTWLLKLTGAHEPPDSIFLCDSVDLGVSVVSLIAGKYCPRTDGAGEPQSNALSSGGAECL